MADSTERLDHPARTLVLDELHARTAPRVRPPALVLHLALSPADEPATRDRSQDVRQLRALAGPDTNVPDGARHVRFQRDGWDVTWESHTEFASYTAVFAGGDPLRTSPRTAYPEGWEATDPGARVAAVAVAVLPMPDSPTTVLETARGWLEPERMVISRVVGGACVLAGDFVADADGFTRFMLFVPDEIGPGRTGRTVQRVVELETYRSLAMLGFAGSQELGARLTTLDPKLSRLVSQLDEPEQPGEELLHELLSVSAELEGYAMAHDFRFGATGAYAAIVEDRVAGLAEERFEGRLTLREFLARRYAPAIRTVTSLEARLGRMIERSGRAADLLRTKVDVERRAQNQALLRDMDARAERQAQLQHTVEGLSVMAMTYYAIGLLGYLLAPVIEETGLSKVWVMAALVPLVLLTAWLGLRFMRARVHRSLDREH
ncbi:putative membrane-anchored protein [Knoellia remsis]|uniref:Putative membrane-anchored protein n=1 Tax=Knoellia remsis TaxID=407159 RepID=A0A2T0TRS6_9MICO|nr:DUF3422 domain-containing protein [Knoellia remsis]PRY48361.1 putative membrane-anchored protein [Knoellia remsis]